MKKLVCLVLAIMMLVAVAACASAEFKFERKIDIYDEKIGLVVKTVKGGIGDSIKASYTLQDDDLYVRARVEESAQPLCTAHLHPQGKHVAWTQPYQK